MQRQIFRVGLLARLGFTLQFGERVEHLVAITISTLEEFDSTLLDAPRRDVVGLVSVGDQVVAIEFDADESLFANEELGDLDGVVAPDLGGMWYSSVLPSAEVSVSGSGVTSPPRLRKSTK